MTAPEPYEWRARAIDEPGDFALQMRRLVIWRRIGDQVEYIAGFTEQGYAIIKSTPADVLPEWRGFVLPADALADLAASLNPGPTHNELRLMSDALDYERRRVDNVLAAWAAGGEGAHQ